MPPKKAKARKVVKRSRKSAVRKAPKRKVVKPRKVPTRKTKPRKTTRKAPRKQPRKPAMVVPKPAREQPSRCKEVENLIGPIELDILDHPQTGQRIVLLGDMHVLRNKCAPDTKCGTPIFLYLHQLFDQYVGSEPLDFFLEVEFAEEVRGTQLLKDPKNLAIMKQYLTETNAYDNFLSSLRVYYFNCFQKIKTQCEYNKKPIRFHYSDVRDGVIHSGTEDETKLVVKQLQELGKLENENEVKEKHIRFLIEFVDHVRTRDVDYFFRLTKIDKQLKHIKNPEIVKLLRIYAFDNMDTKITNFDAGLFQEALAVMLEQVKRNELPIIGKTTFGKIRMSTLASGLAPFFDIYTLARIFRHNMKRVIVYAGSFHTRVMKSFLVDKMGFQVTVSKQSNDETSSSFQCISLKGVPQPWFQ